MSDFRGGDLSTYFTAGASASANALAAAKKNNDKFDLGMEDFLTLMVTELTHQSIDQTADTSEMLNQMVQMQMITAITNLTDASIMSYAASLVGKEVTVGQYDADGNLQELVGEVTGTGTMNGEQVVFVNDMYFYLNEIMAVGRLPEPVEEDPEGGEPEGGASGGKEPESADPGTGGVPGIPEPAGSADLPGVPTGPDDVGSDVTGWI